jgi:hypothetical protein
MAARRLTSVTAKTAKDAKQASGTEFSDPHQENISDSWKQVRENSKQSQR